MALLNVLRFAPTSYQGALSLFLNHRLFAAAANNNDELPKPTYVYPSPGSSIREPGYGTGHSLGNPTYEYDPKPSKLDLATPDPHHGTHSEPSIATSQQQPNKQQRKQQQRMGQQQQQHGGQQEEAPPTPSYVYMPPGSSMKEASYGFSVKEPVYVVDPVPRRGGASAAAASADGGSGHKKQQGGKGGGGGKGAKEQPTVQPPKGGKQRKGLAPDEYANQAYVTSPRGSMKEPHYVSVSDPQDVHANKQ